MSIRVLVGWPWSEIQKCIIRVSTVKYTSKSE